MLANSWENISSQTTHGNLFWGTWLPAPSGNINADTADFSIHLFIASKENATITVSNPQNGWSESFPALANQLTDYMIPTGQGYIEASYNVERKGILIRAVGEQTGDSVCVSAFLGTKNDWDIKGDATLLFPAQLLGREYIVQTYSQGTNTGYAIVATEDLTTVFFSVADSAAQEIVLNQGEVYFVSASKNTFDMSGSTVCADKPIAVFTGHEETYIPKGDKTALKMGGNDHLMEQVLPIAYWGLKYAVIKAVDQPENIVRVTALYDDTEIYVNGSSVASTILSAHQTWETTIPAADASCYIQSSSPIICQQYLRSFVISNQRGNPSLLLVSPLELGTKQATISTFKYDDIEDHIISVVLPTRSAVSSLRIDGLPVSATFNNVAGNQGPVYASIPIAPGVHTLTADTFINTTIYGLGLMISYAYAGPMSLHPQGIYTLIEGERKSWHETCQGVPVQYAAHIDFPYQPPIRWDWGDGTMSESDSTHTEHIFNKNGNFQVKMIVNHLWGICNEAVADTITDSIVVYPNFFKTIKQIICQGDHFTFAGKEYDSDTMKLGQTHRLVDYMISERGCDSVTTLMAFIAPKYYQEYHRTICQQDTCNFNTHKLQGLTKPGVYYDTLLTMYGCDSVQKLTLHVNPSYLIVTDDTICNQQLPYVWKGHQKSYSETGVYWDSLTTTAGGCDSIHKLILTVGNSFYHLDSLTICQGDTYTWRGNNYTKSTHKFDSFTSQYGCDSIYELKLFVADTFYHKQEKIICQGDTYTWTGHKNNTQYSESGTYWDSLTSQYGCDSVYCLQLYVMPSYVYDSAYSICQNESKTWQRRIYKHLDAGIYYDTAFYKTIHGCDSIYRLKLSVYPTYVTKLADETGQNYEYWYDTRGEYLSTAFAGKKRYVDTLQSKNGCDSIVEFTLTVWPTYHYYQTLTECQNPKNPDYVWYDEFGNTHNTPISIGKSGTFTYADKQKTCHGFDSIFHLTLLVSPIYAADSTYTICDNEKAQWQGRSYERLLAGVYYDTAKYASIHGCDSTYRLKLLVYPTRFTQIEATTCQNEEFWYGNRGEYLPTAFAGKKKYIDTLHTNHQCDSIVELTLTVKPTYLHTQSDTICQNESYVWIDEFGGQHPRVPIVTSKAGSFTYTDKLKSKLGCDSTFVLNLSIQPTYISDSIYAICDNESITWQGKEYKHLSEGVYYDTVRYSTHKYQCDSIFCLRLHVYPTRLAKIKDEVCQDEPYWYINRDAYLPTDQPITKRYYDTLKTKYGCDSVIELELTVHPRYEYWQQDTVCQDTLNTQYDWIDQFGGDHSQKIPLSRALAGTYTATDPLKTIHGCDSIFHFSLVVLPIYYFDSTYVICDDDSTFWQGKWYRSSIAGTFRYTKAYKTSSGCDSIFHLTLIASKPTVTHISDSICQDGAYWYNNRNAYLPSAIPGTIHYLDTLKNDVGCDSIVDFALTTLPTYRFVQYDTVCQDKINPHYQWIDQRGGYHPYLISKAKIGDKEYIDSLKTAVGCDSVFILHLFVAPTYQFDSTYIICDNEVLVWQGRTYKGYLPGTFYDTVRYESMYGCDSIFTMRLTINPTRFTQISDSTCDNVDYWYGNHNAYLPHDKIGTFKYRDTLVSKQGCDSVVELNFTVHRTYLYTQFDTICQDREKPDYIWRDQFGNDHSQHTPIRIDRIGTKTYTDHLISQYGCDSIFKITLTVVPTFVFDSSYTICDNEELYWQGKRYKGLRAGSYKDSVHYNTYYGCDSIYRMELTILPTYKTHIFDTICDNQRYTFFENLIQEKAGSHQFEHTLQSIAGCDSTIILHLTVHKTYYFADEYTMCENEGYDWPGHRYLSQYTAGDHLVYDSLTSVNGCDSVYGLLLHVMPTYFIQDRQQICDNDSFEWRGRMFTHLSQGKYVYYDSLQTTQTKCDSIYCLELIVDSTYHHFMVTHICANEEFDFHGQHLTGEPGEYTYDTLLKSVNGCDSLVTLSLIIHPTYFFDDEIRICGNDHYDWHGRTLHKEGIYWDSLTTQFGCDSVYRFVLKLKANYLFVKDIETCDNEPYNFQGQLINEEGTHYHFYQTLEKCDSNYQINLTVHKSFIWDDTVLICSNDSYDFRGIQITKPGVYADSFTTVTGCDSIYRLTLFHKPAYEIHRYDTICSNEYFKFSKTAINKTGIYVDSLISVYGCDSVIIEHLQVKDAFFDLQTILICSNESIDFHGQIVNQTGVYTDSSINIFGCDSVYHLVLTVLPTTEETIIDTICDGDVYTLYDKHYTETGLYEDTTKNAYDCDHYTHLHLTKIAPTKVDVHPEPYCSNDLFLQFGYTYFGMSPIGYSILFSDTAHTQGFTDIIMHPLSKNDSIITAPLPVLYDSTQYPIPNTYYADIIFHTAFCSDSIMTQKVAFDVQYPSWLVVQQWNDVLAILKRDSNGLYDFSDVQWYQNGEELKGENKRYLFKPDYLTFGDEYSALLTRKNDGKAYFTCPITPRLLKDSIMPQLDYFSVVPTIVSKQNPVVYILTSVKGMYKLFNATGSLLKQERFEPGDKNEMKVVLPSASSYYIFDLITDNGKQRSIKVIVGN